MTPLLQGEEEHVVLNLDSPSIPESNTARVKPRPTIKYHTASGSSPDDLHGFAVPAPKVPLLPPANGTKPANGSISSSRNSIPVKFDGKGVIPPRPPMEPPPPPPQINPPASFPSQPPAPPSWQPPSPKLQTLSVKNPDVTPLLPQAFHIDPPGSNASVSHLFMQSHSPVSFKHDSIAPYSRPDLSTGGSQPTSPRTQKVPPPKPNRVSSLSSQDEIPELQSPVPPTGDATPSSFNPQNKAKLYNMPKANFGVQNGEPKLKPILLLEDSPTDPFVAKANNKAPTPTKGLGLAPVQTPAINKAQNNAAETQLQKNLSNVLDTLIPTSPIETTKAQKIPLRDSTSSVTSGNSSEAVRSIPEHSSKLLETSPKTSKSYRLDIVQKPYQYNRERRATGLNKTASPMSLLLAAKERDKHKTFATSDKSTLTSEPSAVSVGQNDTSHVQASTLVSTAGHVREAPGHRENEKTGYSMLSLSSVCEDDALGVIPPPPEFANFGEDLKEESLQFDPPPSLPPPDPLTLKIPPPPPPPPPPLNEMSISSMMLTPKPKPAVPSASPKILHADSQSEPAFAAPSLFESQMTLQSILEKKQLEMDQRRSDSPNNSTQSKSVQDFSSSVGQHPSIVKENPTNSRNVPSQIHSLFLSELQKKMSKMEPKAAKSSDPPSRPSHGMTFRVQPRSQQPITVIKKGDPS